MRTSLDYSRSELIGKQIEMLLPQSMRSAHAASREEYASAPRSRPMGQNHLKLAGLMKGGEELELEIALTPKMTSRGLLVIAIVRNLTGGRDGGAV